MHLGKSCLSFILFSSLLEWAAVRLAYCRQYWDTSEVPVWHFLCSISLIPLLLWCQIKTIDYHHKEI